MTASSPVGARSASPPSIVLNVTSRWGAHVFSLVVSLFLTPFVVSRLGDSGYGLWTLLASLTGYLGLADIGVRSAVTRYVAKFRAEASHDRASTLVSSALRVFTGAAALVLVASVALALLAVDHFRIPADARGTARVVLVLIGVNVATALLSGVFGGVIAGLQRFDVINLVEMGLTAVRAVIIVAVLGAGGGLVALALIHLTLALGRGLAEVLLSRRLYPQVRVRLLDGDHGSVRLIFSHGLYAFLMHLAAQLIYYSDSIVIGLFLPVSSITFFAIASTLVRQAGALVAGIRYTLAPLATSLEATHDSALPRVALDAARYCTAVMLPVYVTFLLRGHSFIGLWMGQEYAGPSGAVLAVLTLGSAFEAGPGALGIMVLGIGRHRPASPAGLRPAGRRPRQSAPECPAGPPVRCRRGRLGHDDPLLRPDLAVLAVVRAPDPRHRSHPVRDLHVGAAGHGDRPLRAAHLGCRAVVARVRPRRVLRAGRARAPRGRRLPLARLCPVPRSRAIAAPGGGRGPDRDAPPGAAGPSIARERRALTGVVGRAHESHRTTLLVHRAMRRARELVGPAFSP